MQLQVTEKFTPQNIGDIKGVGGIWNIVRTCTMLLPRDMIINCSLDLQNKLKKFAGKSVNVAENSNHTKIT